MKTVRIFSFALCVLLTFLLFRETLHHMVARWNNPDYNYAYIMPGVVAYLLWQRRQSWLRELGKVSWWGIAPLFWGIGLYWLGELGGEYLTLYTAFFFVILGLLWIHWGWLKLKTILFPILLIPTMFPLPNFLQTKLTFRLQLASSALGVKLLHLFGMPALREGNVIDIGFTQLQVVEACSGLRFVFPLGILSVLLASFMKGAFWRKGVLVLCSIPLAVALNALRIAATGVLYEWLGPAVAEGFFHDFSGWVVFMVAFGMLLGILWLFTKIPPFRSGENHAHGSSDVSPKPRKGTDLSSGAARSRGSRSSITALPLAVLILASTTAVSSNVDFRRDVPLVRSLAVFSPTLGPWHGTRYYLDNKTLKALDLSDYTAMVYRTSESPPVDFYVAYYSSQRKGESIHSPETCLPGAGWVLENAQPYILNLYPEFQGRTINRMVMRTSDRFQLVYFWFDLRGRTVVNAYQIKLYNFWDALTQRRTDGALIRVITPVLPSESLNTADQRLQDFLRYALPELDKHLRR